MTDTLLQMAYDLPRGKYLVIPADESKEVQVIDAQPTIGKVYAHISTPERACVCCETITVRRSGCGNTKDPIVMLVDDTGMIDKLPINFRATTMMRQAREFRWTIHGTAVVVNDMDFGD